MGRELQKKKNRSSISKVRQKPKSKKINVKSNPIVAANWDQSQTLAQNYKRLGLSAKLNARSGGTERLASVVTDPSANNDAIEPRDSLAVNKKSSAILTPGEVRIERDPKTGAILKVIRDQHERSNPLNDPLNDIEDDQEVEGPNGRFVDNGVIRALEEQATMEAKKRPRQQSQREEEWIEALVEKYGDDYGKMMRDRKLNPMQQSEGDLKRRVRRWQQSRSG